MTIKRPFWFILIAIVVAVLGHGFLDAQQQRYRQTDPQDMKTRQKIDRDLYEQLWLLDKEIQADSLKLDAGQTTDTAYLDHKYSDLNYMVFVQIRWAGATTSTYYAAPISDSSFMITKNSNDASIVQWMTIHDREGD
jgi:hypothetical protein